MRSLPALRTDSGLHWIVVCLAALAGMVAVSAGAGAQSTSTSRTFSPAGIRTFSSPEQAANALVAAAETFNVRELVEIFGTDGEDIVLTGEYTQDRLRAEEFAAKAREKASISRDPVSARRAFLIVGNESWPFPVPMVRVGQRWAFDAAAGKQELRARLIGHNELDAIEISRGYVEAQHEFALRTREGYGGTQYAQRVISTPGTQDGLAWRQPDGTWGGDIGEEIAAALNEGYNSRSEPYHGYFFKPLTGQGPAAPLGQMDYVVNGVMIGGFALVAAPAQYGITGIKTFIVSQDGVVYEKDLGPATSDEFARMQRFNPDRSWTPVPDEED